MKKDDELRKLIKPRKYPLVFATIIAFTMVLATAVSTFAWFQAEANVQVQTTSTSATITVQAPDDLVKFYYFKGNGTPGGDYTGYSKYGAAFGNATNVVGKETNKFSTNGGTTNITIDSVAANANAWGLIDLDSVSTASGVASPKNCFNFSAMRPGCYYSFCVYSDLSTSSLAANFSWNGASGITGDNDSLSPKRRVYDNSASPKETSYPLNLLMAVNSYCAISTAAGAATYIGNTVADTPGMADKIVYTDTSGTSQAYTLLSSSSNNTATNKYIYFTIFMGMPNQSDALSYVKTVSSIAYYQRISTPGTGSYAPLDGLKSTLTSLVVS